MLSSDQSLKISLQMPNWIIGRRYLQKRTKGTKFCGRSARINHRRRRLNTLPQTPRPTRHHKRRSRIQHNRIPLRTAFATVENGADDFGIRKLVAAAKVFKARKRDSRIGRRKRAAVRFNAW